MPKTLRAPSAPTLKSDFIGGHFRSFRKDPTGFLTRLADRGDVTTFRLGSQQAFFINDPEMVRDLLVVNADKFVKGRALQRARTVLGDGLLTSEGEFHLRQRRMIQPAFHRARIAEYAAAMVTLAAEAQSRWRHGQVIDVDKEMMQLTLRIVGATLFGADVRDKANDIGNAMTELSEMFNFLLLPGSQFLQRLPLPHSRRLRKARATLDSVIFEIISDRRRSNIDAGDLLSMLLLARDENDGGAMTDGQIRDEALTLFLAGHETTANALTFTWYLLSTNPDAAACLHAEIDNLLAGRTPSIDDIPHLTYTEKVVAESMRLFPPAWVVGRLATKPHDFGEFEVPAGSLVLASPFVMHRDARFWRDPELFDPERWSIHSVKEFGQKYIYFPFGGGVRRCIGETFAWTEATLLIATIAAKWRFTLEPSQRLGLSPMITLRPKFGMKMKAERR